MEHDWESSSESSTVNGTVGVTFICKACGAPVWVERPAVLGFACRRRVPTRDEIAARHSMFSLALMDCDIVQVQDVMED